MSQIFEQNWVISATVSVVRILINYSKDDDEKSVSVLFTTMYLFIYSHLSNKRDVTLTDFEKFHPTQLKNPPYTFIDFLDPTLHVYSSLHV